MSNFLYVSVLMFVAGFGWGQWYAERQIRKDQNSLTRGRLAMSMPMKEENASHMLGLLKDLTEQAERENAKKVLQ